VNAHHAATEEDGVRDGVRRGDSWVAFQGGHYRLSDWCYDVVERQPVSPNGEIHLGPGRQWLDYGALVEATGGRYLANASHNAGILYHEYGHDITRHTADFRANASRRGGRQSNRKIATDEGTCDYWTAAMLETPHIWAWHRRHDAEQVHPRSLVSTKTMAEFDYSAGADPHANGTIWAATLWDLRAQLARSHEDGARKADRLVLKALLLIGSMVGDGISATVESIMKAREGFDVGLAAMLRADTALYGSQHSPLILETFAKRGIFPAQIRMPA
jgi:Fungalysin metallopeptidase (M36)